MAYLCTQVKRAVPKGDTPVGAWLILHGGLQRNKRNRLRSRAIFDLWFGLAYTVGFPLSAPVLSWLFTAQSKSENIPCPAAIAMRESTIHLGVSSSACLATALKQGPLYPTLRANPFPKVTDLFCRLPLPTLGMGTGSAQNYFRYGDWECTKLL